MAPRLNSKKRKHDSEASDRKPPRKRQKPLKTSSSEDDQIWQAKGILKETSTKYLIDWEGTDPTTGEPYAPTWEPKKNALPGLVKPWKSQKKNLRSRSQKPESPAAAPSEPASTGEPIPSSPPLQLASARPEARPTTFEHSQPTPIHTPEQTILGSSSSPGPSSFGNPVATGKATTAKATVTVVPSKLRLDSDLYQTFSTQQPTSSSASAELASSEKKPSSERAKTDFVVPETQEPDSSSFLPDTTDESRTQSATQRFRSSFAESSDLTQSPPEEIAKFRRELISASNSVIDSVSSQSQHPSDIDTQSAFDTQTRDKSGHSTVGSAAKSRSYPSASSLAWQQVVLNPQIPEQDSNAETSPRFSSARAATSELGRIICDSDKLSSKLHDTPPDSALTSEKDWAETSRISGTAGIHQSIERSPACATPADANCRSNQAAKRSLDQAGISTEEERSDRRKAATGRIRHAFDQAQKRNRSSLGCNTQHHYLQHILNKDSPEPRDRQGAALSNTSHLSDSTPFATQISRTFQPTMDPSSIDTTPDHGAQKASRSLAETLAEGPRSGPRRGRALKDIALGHGIKEGTRSPSTIPDKYPFPNPPDSDRSRMRIEDFGPELPSVSATAASVDAAAAPQEPADAPNVASRSSPLSAPPDEMDNAEGTEDSATFPNLGPGEHALTLSSPGSSIDAYRKHLTANAKLITDFCSRTWPQDDDIVAQAARLAQELKNYVTHPDLENEEALTQETSPNESLSALSEWDMSVSAKFNFLANFLPHLDNVDVHVVVTTGNAVIVDKLKTFLTGRGVRVGNALDHSILPPQSPSLFVSIVHTTGQAIDVPRPADFIVAFDNNLDVTDSKTMKLRQNAADPTVLAPVLHLFVDYSIEHVEFCLPRNLVGVERLQRLLNYTTVYRRSAGKLGSYEPRPQDAGPEVARYVYARQGGAAGLEWPLPMPDIIDVEPQSQSSSSSTSTRSDRDDPVVGQKRPLADDTSDESKKRVRISSVSASNATEEPSTRVDDSATSRLLEAQAAASQKTEAGLTGARTGSQSGAGVSDSMLKLSNQNIGLTAAIEGLQTRYEEQTKELRTTRKELKAAEDKIGIFGKRMETQEATITALKEERAALKKLAQERWEALQASSVPELAELEKMRAALAAMEKERDIANKRYESGEKTHEYVTTEYQKASGRAMELTGEVEALKVRNAELEKKASGEAVKLKQLVNADRDKAWSEENELLRGEIESLKILVTRLQDQKRELQNQGRVQTRQGSMPPAARSPRLGSRAGSPAPGGFGGPASRFR